MEGGTEPPPFPKICHTYPTMMEPGTVISYLKKIKKKVNHMTHLLSSADIRFFRRKSVNFAISKNTDIDGILIHDCFNSHGYNFDDVSKNDYPRPS